MTQQTAFLNANMFTVFQKSQRVLQQIFVRQQPGSDKERHRDIQSEALRRHAAPRKRAASHPEIRHCVANGLR